MSTVFRNRIATIIIACAGCYCYFPAPLPVFPTDPTDHREHLPCNNSADNSFVFMFYNVENLFDAVDDILKDDEEFLPGGTRGWSHQKYYHKLNSIAKVILSAGDWDPPALIGFCETENMGVAEALVRSTPLSNYNYGVVYTESDDRRGIDIGLLYNRDMVEILYFKAFTPQPHDEQPVLISRPVLYVKVNAADKPLHIFLNHWPSRRGGVMAGQDARHRLANTIRELVDSLFVSDGSCCPILIAGDFNCDPAGAEMKPLVSNGLINLAYQEKQSGIGTYRYRGVWQMFDQIIVSESMTNGNAYFSAKNFKIHSPDFLMTNDPVYPGKKPFSTYDGYRYTGGFSDHLPVKVTLEF